MFVMAGLDPAIFSKPARAKKDARLKAGHDGARRQKPA
jgi:hypothetical protein